MTSPTLLKTPRLEAKPKHVRMLPEFKEQLLKMRAAEPAYFTTIFQLLNLILGGKGFPEKYYRDYIDIDVDDMLVKYGFMHIHFAPKKSGDERLLILLQYDSVVVACKLSGHDVFRYPPGAALAAELRGEIDRTIALYQAELSSGQPPAKFK